MSVESQSRFRFAPDVEHMPIAHTENNQKITGSIEYQNGEQDTPKIVNFTVDNATEPMYEGDAVSFRVTLDLRLRQLKVCCHLPLFMLLTRLMRRRRTWW